jgi:diadenosine tetraphosphatase ApaH/serine/threonine PP2A family protein phosphatase
MQFNLMAGPTVVLNPGSVGQPRDGDPRAAYAIIEDGRIELKRIDYPIEEAVRRVEAADLPDRAKALLTTSLREGRLPAHSPTLGSSA